MARIRTDLQLQKSTTPGTILISDVNNDFKFSPPPAVDGVVLTIKNGVPSYEIPSFDAWFGISRPANTFFASPANVSGPPTWRTLLNADIPNISWNKITTDKPTTISGFGITDFNALWEARFVDKTQSGNAIQIDGKFAGIGFANLPGEYNIDFVANRITNFEISNLNVDSFFSYSETGIAQITDLRSTGTISIYNSVSDSLESGGLTSFIGKNPDNTPVWRAIVKSDVTGINNVDNTSDLNKPVSTATQTAINAKFTTPTGLTTNYVPKWNGTAFVNTNMFHSGSNTGWGTTTPGAFNHVNVTTQIGQIVQSNVSTATALVQYKSGLGSIFNYNSDGSLDYKVASGVSFYINSNGNVTVGGNDNTHKLKVVGTGHYTEELTLDAIATCSVIPTAANHLTNKAYVDSLASIKKGDNVKTISLTTLTKSGLYAINGYTPAAGELVLDASGTSASGVYVVGSGAWTRSITNDSDTEIRGAYHLITNGNFANQRYINTNTSPITLNTTAITYAVDFGAETDPIFTAFSTASRAANSFYAGPSAVAGAATFRAISSADIPILDYATKINNKPTTLAGYGISSQVTDNFNTNFATRVDLNEGLPDPILFWSDVNGRFEDMGAWYDGNYNFTGAIVGSDAHFNRINISSSFGTAGQYLRSSGASQAWSGIQATDIPSLASTYQVVSPNLTNFLSLNTNGLVRKTATDTWTIDTADYITRTYTGHIAPNSTVGTSNQFLRYTGTNDVWTTLSQDYINFVYTQYIFEGGPRPQNWQGIYGLKAGDNVTTPVTYGIKTGFNQTINRYGWSIQYPTGLYSNYFDDNGRLSYITPDGVEKKYLIDGETSGTPTQTLMNLQEVSTNGRSSDQRLQYNSIDYALVSQLQSLNQTLDSVLDNNPIANNKQVILNNIGSGFGLAWNNDIYFSLQAAGSTDIQTSILNRFHLLISSASMEIRTSAGLDIRSTAQPISFGLNNVTDNQTYIGKANSATDYIFMNGIKYNFTLPSKGFGAKYLFTLKDFSTADERLDVQRIDTYVDGPRTYLIL